MTYREAKKAGKVLLAKMKTAGWLLNVWQSSTSGRFWNVCIENAFVRIYISEKRSEERAPYYEIDASTFGQGIPPMREKDPNLLVIRLHDRLVELVAQSVNQLDQFDANFVAKK